MLTVVFDQVVAQQQKQHNTTTLLTPPDLLPSSSPSLTDLFKHVENSVVQITSIKSNPDELVIINGNPITGQSTALGSGFVYDKQGHIITNYHVIAGASRVEATFIDGNTYPVKVIGKDPYSDLSILQITDNFSKEKIFPVVLGNSSRLQVGEQVINIGNPFGLSGTMTTGIVSQLGRSIPSPVGGYLIPNGIQTDAAINPGNSGGPLLNVQGEVIGMNTAIISNTGAYSGIGFAIPSNTIAREVPTLIKTGTYAHPWLGLSGGKVTPALAKSAGLPQN
jgi:S1-C subfamily serine protease